VPVWVKLAPTSEARSFWGGAFWASEAPLGRPDAPFGRRAFWDAQMAKVRPRCHRMLWDADKMIQHTRTASLKPRSMNTRNNSVGLEKQFSRSNLNSIKLKRTLKITLVNRPSNSIKLKRTLKITLVNRPSNSIKLKNTSGRSNLKLK
jgi:hypothetical protein